MTRARVMTVLWWALSVGVPLAFAVLVVFGD